MASVIASKAAALPSAQSINPAVIIAIIQAILAALSSGGVCPQPTPPVPPKQGPGERWWVRNQVRQHLQDPEAFRSWGRELADEILHSAANSTPEEIAAMFAEAG